MRRIFSQQRSAVAFGYRRAVSGVQASQLLQKFIRRPARARQNSQSIRYVHWYLSVATSVVRKSDTRHLSENHCSCPNEPSSKYATATTTTQRMAHMHQAVHINANNNMRSVNESHFGALKRRVRGSLQAALRESSAFANNDNDNLLNGTHTIS